MIYKANNKIIGIFYGSIPIIRTYYRENIVWLIIDSKDLVQSCFSSGYWIDEYPWTDDTSWTD